MKSYCLIILLFLVEINAYSQSVWGSYSYAVPEVRLINANIYYNGYNYDYDASFSFDAKNCLVLRGGVIGGSSPNITLDYHYLGASASFIGDIFGNKTVYRTAGVNQVPFYLKAFIITAYDTVYSDECIFLSPNVRPPFVSTQTIINIQANSATGGGNVTSDGGATVTSRGVCWNKTGTPTIYDSKTTDGSGTGSFTSSLTGLSEDTTYYVRAYATNSAGTAYGSTVIFTTDNVSISVPTVTTTSITTYDATSATMGGAVMDDGGSAVTESGIVYNTTGSPDTSNVKVLISSGTGAFSQSVSGLIENTTYYVRAYAINSEGISYGSEESFTASEGLNLSFQLYETHIASTDSFNVESSTNTAYIYLGIKYYDSYFTIINPPDDATGTKTFGSYPSLNSIYYRFMNYSPYYSVWASGVSNPSSSDTVTIYTDLQFAEAKTIHVGLIGDNYFSMHLNGELLVRSEYIAQAANFTYVNIFPVNVISGNNRLSFSGIGDGAVSQALGVIIWDNTKDELFTNPVTKDSWNVLWSSNDAINSNVYSCPSGYSYDETADACVKISDISNWSTGDTVFVSMYVPENIQSNISGWSLKAGGVTIDSGTSYKPNTIVTGLNSGNNEFEYSISLSGGNSRTITKSIIL